MVDATKDCWEPGGYVYQHYGKRYVTTITDGNVNIGCLETVQKPADTKQEVELIGPKEKHEAEVLPRLMGRPKLSLPDQEIQKLASLNLGTRNIVKTLSKRGIKVSRSSVQRRIKELQGSLL